MKNPCTLCERKNESKKDGKCKTCDKPRAYADAIYDASFGRSRGVDGMTIRVVEGVVGSVSPLESLIATMKM